MKKNKMLFIMIICNIFFGAINFIFTYIALIWSIFVAFVIGSKKSNENSDICIGLIMLLCLQNFCIGLGAHLVNNESASLSLLTQIPFLVLTIIWIMGFLKGEYKATKSFKWFRYFLIVIVISSLIKVGTVNAILITIRNSLVFFMSYMIGENYIDSKEKLDKFCKSFLKITMFMFVIGCILLIGGETLYNFIGLKEVYIAKNVASTTIINGLPGRFYTKLFYKALPRMGSLYYEPVNLAYLFAFGTLISLFYRFERKSSKSLYVVVNVIGLLLTVGKGGFFVVGLSIAFYYIYIFNRIISKKMNVSYIRIVSIFTIITVVVLFVTTYVKAFHGVSVLPHIWAIEKTWDVIIKKPLGHGLGVGGNMANLYNERGSDSNGSESALMTILYQFGIQGGICLYMIFKNLYSKLERTNKMSVICFYMPYVLLITSIFQENTFTPQCIVFYMIFIGGMNNMQEIIEKERV